MSTGKGIAIASPWAAVMVSVCVNPYAGVIVAVFAMVATVVIVSTEEK